MIYFIKKFFIFFLIGFIVINLLAQLVFDSQYSSKLMRASRAHKVIIKSKKPVNSKVIIIGDSVCHQIFNNNLPYSFAVNGAILTIGNYILVKNILEINKGIKYIVLISSPAILNYNFDRSKTYGYFMKPFYTFGNLNEFSDETFKNINSKPLSHISILPIIKVSSMFSDINFGENNDPRAFRNKFSDITIFYLKKIKKLCEKNKVEFIIASTPLNRKRKSVYKNWTEMKNQIKNENLDQLFEWYFKSMFYLEKNIFFDRVHLKKQYIRRNRNFLLKKILPERVLIELNKFEKLEMK